MRKKISQICKSREFKVVPSPRSRQVLTQYFFFPPSFSLSFFVYIFVFSPLSNFLRPSLNFLAVCLGETNHGREGEGGKRIFCSFFLSFFFPLFQVPWAPLRMMVPLETKLEGENRIGQYYCSTRQIAGNLFTFLPNRFIFIFIFIFFHFCFLPLACAGNWVR